MLDDLSFASFAVIGETVIITGGYDMFTELPTELLGLNTLLI